MTLTAVIVDDERLARSALNKLLTERNDVEVLGQASNVTEAAALVQELDPDVIFLDVQMPGGSGFELFERAAPSAHVIFVTAYDQHALRAFEVNALDYLLKPVTPEGIARALSRIPSNQDVPTPSTAEAPLVLDDIVCLHDGQGMKFVAVRDISFITAADDYSDVHLRDGRTVLSNTSLKRWEERLPPQTFARIHRSTLVNLLCVGTVTQDGSSWLVSVAGSQDSLTMSRRFAQALKKRMAPGG